MKNLDINQERQVWQRVLGSSGPVADREELAALLPAAEAGAADYRFLAGALPGPAREQARRLWENARWEISTLRGMLRLSGSAVGKPGPAPAAASPDQVLLRCFHRARRAAMEYTARSPDAEFGMVFRLLAQEKERECAAIVRLAGRE